MDVKKIQYDAVQYDVLLASGKVVKMSFGDILGQSSKTLLYFYPKDNTPGCTIENKDFSCFKEKFTSLGIHLFGVSRDSIVSHEKFVVKHNLAIDLISDPSLTLHTLFDVYKEKKSFGKTVMGVVRSTFLVDTSGKILKERRNVRAKGHVEKILEDLLF